MLEALSPPGITEALLPQLYKYLSDDQLWLSANYTPMVGWLFPEEMKERMMQVTVQALGSSGMTEVDLLPRSHAIGEIGYRRLPCRGLEPGRRPGIGI